MASFDWNKNIEDSIKNGLIITATTTGIFFALKAANVKPTRASLDAMDIVKLAGGFWGVGVDVGERLCSLQKMDQQMIQQMFYGP